MMILFNVIDKKQDIILFEQHHGAGLYVFFIVFSFKFNDIKIAIEWSRITIVDTIPAGIYIIGGKNHLIPAVINFEIVTFRFGKK